MEIQSTSEIDNRKSKKPIPFYIDVVAEYRLARSFTYLQREIIYKQKRPLNVFIKGSFDCVHLGHFAMLAEVKVRAKDILGCNIEDIFLTVVLAQQDGGKYKGVTYLQSEIERMRAIENTGLADRIAFCENMIEFTKENLQEIDLLFFGYDQLITTNKDRLCFFKQLESICKYAGIRTALSSERTIEISSTKIRGTMVLQSLSYEEAKKKEESSVVIPKRYIQMLKTLRDAKIIDDKNLTHFNINSDLKTARMLSR